MDPYDTATSGGEQHVAIVIEPGKTVADMWEDDYRLKIREIPNYLSWNDSGSGVSHYYTYVAHLYNFDGIEFSPIVEESSEWDSWFTDFKPKGEVDPIEVDLDKLEFEFAGNPSKVDYTPEPLTLQWLFSKMSQFVDYILGIVLTIIKGSIVGWTSIIEGWINSAFKLLSGG